MTAPAATAPPGRIVVDQLTKVFRGNIRAVDRLSFTVEPGSVTGFLGPNGAGKTTTLRMVLGLVHPTGGQATIGGRPYRHLDAPTRAVGAALESSSFHPARSARNHLRIMCIVAGIPAQRADEVLAVVGLQDAARRKVRGYSLGMRQRLGLAAALLTRPRLLVLDEPANGLDPAGARHVHRVITGLAATGTAVILSSHRMDDLAALCSEVTLLATGRIVFSGTVAKLAAESGELDYRLRTSDPDNARRVAAGTPDVRVFIEHDRLPRQDAETLVVRGPVPALDELVIRLVGAGVAVRELAPVVAPLEAAFLALTDGEDAPAIDDDQESR
ncbi:MAG: ABC transporter ATP-binding protein [Actinoallomurus sp.]